MAVACNYVARLNNVPATQTLGATSASRIEWLRGGSSPETNQVTFELSTNGGLSYTFLVSGTRIAGGWECTAIHLPASGQIRARARTRNGSNKGVLLIGDSISGGYEKQVKQLLNGKANVVNNEGNAEWTGTRLKRIDGYLGDTKWDIIHFNWGLWDLYGWEYHAEDRSPEAYAKRLHQLVTRIKQTGANWIWAPLPRCAPALNKRCSNALSKRS